MTTKLILLTMLCFLQLSFALDRLPVPGDSPNSPEMALSKLKQLSSDSRYQACKSAMDIFKNSFSTADEEALRRHQSNFNATDLRAWVDSKRKSVPTLKISDIDSRKDMKSINFSVTHNGQLCQFSILPQMPDDWIKAMIHPKFSNLAFKDSKSNEFFVSAEQLGVATSEKKGAEIIFDPSKVLGHLEKMGITNTGSRDDVFEKFEVWQKENPSGTSADAKTPPPK